MKEEISAGGVVWRQEQGHIFVLVSQHSGHHGWVFPKGHVGDKVEGESKEEAALREVKEETGILGTITHPLSPITYWYQFNGEKRHKTVWYFLMKYTSGSIEDHDFEMEKVEWLPMEEVAERLTYPGDKKVWEEAKKVIETVSNPH